MRKARRLARRTPPPALLAVTCQLSHIETSGGRLPSARSGETKRVRRTRRREDAMATGIERTRTGTSAARAPAGEPRRSRHRCGQAPQPPAMVHGRHVLLRADDQLRRSLEPQRRAAEDEDGAAPGTERRGSRARRVLRVLRGLPATRRQGGRSLRCGNCRPARAGAGRSPPRGRFAGGRRVRARPAAAGALPERPSRSGRLPALAGGRATVVGDDRGRRGAVRDSRRLSGGAGSGGAAQPRAAMGAGHVGRRRRAGRIRRVVRGRSAPCHGD